MKLSEITKQSLQEIVSPEVHAANKKIGHKLTDVWRDEKKAQSPYDNESHNIQDRIHARTKKEIEAASPGELHANLKDHASANTASSRTDEMAREHFQGLKSKIAKSKPTEVAKPKVDEDTKSGIGSFLKKQIGEHGGKYAGAGAVGLAAGLAAKKLLSRKKK